MAGLSRWAGGLLDRFGARLPLVIGPAIAALGIGVMAVTVTNGSYWQFLVSIVVLGFGMVVSVAPLTTTVINAVPAHHVGVASGINNAVSSVANFLQSLSSAALRWLPSITRSINTYKVPRFPNPRNMPSELRVDNW